MAKGTMLDRLAEAMYTLSKRQEKKLTPRQRVAAAQRWTSLADIGEAEVERLKELANEAGNRGAAQSRYVNGDEALVDMGIGDGEGFRADNPFLSNNIDKYAEQSDFLDWCRYNRVEPNGRTLKQYRWETYQALPYRERQWIANKDAIRQGVQDEGFVSPATFTDDLMTLRDLDEAALDYTGSKYDFMKLPVYNSYDEFPDDFDYMWRY